MKLILGEPIHLTSEDLKPVDAADIQKAIDAILNWRPQEEFANEEETPSE